MTIDAAGVVRASLTFVDDADDPRDRISPRRRIARRAVVCGLVGLVCFGFIFGPMAFALGQRLRMAMVADDDLTSARAVHTAVLLGRIGMAVHLTLAMAVLPWLLFAFPLLVD
jgi:fatty acid desaturase